MAKRIALKTGGLGAHLASGITADGAGSWQRMFISVKALYRNIEGAVEIVRDVLTAGDLTDDARMRDLILEKKNGLHASVIPSGHLFAQMAAAAALSIPSWRNEQWHGRTQLRFLSRTAGSIDEMKEELREKLTRLRRIVFTRNRLHLNLTADGEGGEGMERLTREVRGLADCLPAGESAAGTKERPEGTEPIGIAIPAQVCYVAKVLARRPIAIPFPPPVCPGRQLSNGYLYRHIRVQGGAYGAPAGMNP
jgi:Zn-dependent M16 (insulinase) family peptidase